MQRCDSYYTHSINQETDYPRLEGQVRVDVAIIGGGFTGVATAVELSEKGYKVAIIEANKIGWGATGRNGGQVTGSLSGDAAMTRQLRKTLGLRQRILSGTCAGAVTTLSKAGWRNTASTVISSMVICKPLTNRGTYPSCKPCTTKLIAVVWATI